MIITPKNGNKVPGETGLSLCFKGPVLLAGGGTLSEDAYNLARVRSHFFVGADGGADAILSKGEAPDAVIGDLDSLSQAARALIPSQRIHHIAEQDSTDFEKALRGLLAPLVYAVGFSGGRLDHELAALHALVRYPDQRAVVIGAQDITVHVPARITLTLEVGTRVSLFPLDAVVMGAQGLEWSFDALALHPARKIGTSNAASAPEVTITTDAPGLLLILPHEALDAVTQALANADFHSPTG